MVVEARPKELARQWLVVLLQLLALEDWPAYGKVGCRPLPPLPAIAEGFQVKGFSSCQLLHALEDWPAVGTVGGWPLPPVHAAPGKTRGKGSQRSVVNAGS